MFHVSSRPVTFTVVPTSRRAASRTVANASGSSSSSASRISSRYFPSNPPEPAAPVGSRSMRSRSSGSAAVFLVSFSAAICALSSAVRARIASRNFSVCALSSASPTDFSRSPIPLISSTIGWTRFRSRSCRVPTPYPSLSFSLTYWAPLPGQPPTLDVSGHRLRHESADRLSRVHPRTDLRRRHVHAPRFYRSSRRRRGLRPARAPQHDDFRERGHVGRLTPLRQRRRRIRSKKQDQSQGPVRLPAVMKGPKRVNRVRYPAPLDFDGVRREARVAFHEPFDHGQAVSRGCHDGRLQRLACRRHEQDSIQPQRLVRVAGGQEMTDGGGIEGAPEDADAHGLKL